MKKIITLTLALLLVTAAGCASQQTAAPEETEMMTVKPEDHAVGMANPWAEYDTLSDAEAAAGVAFPQPKWEFSYDTVIYRAMDGIVEVIYTQDDGQRLTLRKGADETDISGDYTAYDFTETREGFTIKGQSNEQGDQLCKTALWVEGGHFYVIYADLSETMDAMVGIAQVVSAAQRK